MNTRIDPIKHQPKPKPPTPKPKKGIMRGRKRRSDLLKVLFDIDAGADTSGDRQKSSLKLIRSLSKAELSRLEKRILTVMQKQIGEERGGRKKGPCRRMVDLIRQQIARSSIEENAFFDAVKKKLQALDIEEVECSVSGSVNYLFIKGKRVEIKRFIDDYFSEELKEIELLLKRGVLVKQKRGHGPRSFLRRFIRDYYSSFL